MDEWINMLKTSKPAKGHSRVLYPGQAEAEVAEDRLNNGIPLHSEVVEWFESACKEHGIPFELV